VESGCLLLTVDGAPQRLTAGDAAYFHGDRRHAFANDADDIECVYYLAMALGRPNDAHDRSPRSVNFIDSLHGGHDE
jgi:quercetin dioxygenase-like cupin family protein